MRGSWCDSCESAVAIKSLFSCRAMALATKYPPHQINYRANIAALLDLGVTEIVAVNAVGAIHGDLLPGSIAVPDQLIDYSYSRDVSFYDGKLKKVHHIDFTNPYNWLFARVFYKPQGRSTRVRKPAAKSCPAVSMPARKGRGWRPPQRFGA